MYRIGSASRQGGVTMFEILLVVIVLVSILGVSVRQYSIYSREQNATATAMSVRLIARAALQGYESQETFAGINGAAVNALIPSGSGFVFDERRGWFVIAQGARIAVAPVAVNGTNNSGFELALSGIDSNQCVAVTRQLEREFYEIVVARTLVKTGGLDNATDLALVLDACTSLGATGRVAFRSAG